MRSTRARQVWLLAFTALWVWTGCGGESDDGDGAAGMAGAGASGESGASGSAGMSGQGGSSSDPEAEIGVFGVQLVAPVEASGSSAARPGSTVIIGSVGDKPATESKIWELASESGDCQLLVPRVPFCDPGCGSGEVCVEDGMCVAERTAIDVGEVTVSGVMTTAGADSVTLTAIRNTYQNGTMTLPFPAFAEGDPITLDAAGAGAVPAFSIDSNGIAPLELVQDAPYVVDGEADLALAWMAPSDPSSSRILVKLEISHHGGEKGKIECDVDDTGSFVVPADMQSDLIALGVAGFPTVTVTRSAQGTAQLPGGRVRLRVYQYEERSVTVPGVVSCESEAQCQAGETCLDNKTCG